jgi:hypothetical protein
VQSQNRAGCPALEHETACQEWPCWVARFAGSDGRKGSGVKPDVGAGVVCNGGRLPTLSVKQVGDMPRFGRADGWRSPPGPSSPARGILRRLSFSSNPACGFRGGNRHHPEVIGSVDIEQGEWELCQPKLLDLRHIRHAWLAPSPASRRPIRGQLGAPNRRASGPRFLRTVHQTVPRASPEPPRSKCHPHY